MKIAILYGGKSGEHEISLISAAAVARNISSEHEIKLIGITKKGRWFLQADSELARIKSDEKASLQICEDESNEVSVIPGGGSERAFFCGGKSFKIDVVFPVLHGTFGEDGTVQGLLEMAELPYVGCGTMASAATMDKEKTKAIWQNAGLPVVPYICARRSDLATSDGYDRILEDAQKMGYPLFVKPCSAGSSDGANKAEDLQHLNGAILEAFNWDDKILIEKCIDAREIECSVTGNPTTYSGEHDEEKVQAFGPGEIAPKHGFYDYDTKYNDPDGADLWIPAHIDEDERREILELAKKAYTVLDASGLSRVDFFKDRQDGKIYLNEINTMPGFTQISMFPKLCGHEGLGFTDLTEVLIKEAIFRFKSTRNLQTSR